MTLTNLLVPQVDCPECGGEAQIVRDTSGEIYDRIEPVLESLQKECLHWEYLDTESYLEYRDL